MLALVLAVAVLNLTGLRLWPSLPNPFATRRVDRSPPVLLKAIEDLACSACGRGWLLAGDGTLEERRSDAAHDG
jgi:hypothetical protein